MRKKYLFIFLLIFILFSLFMSLSIYFYKLKENEYIYNNIKDDRISHLNISIQKEEDSLITLVIQSKDKQEIIRLEKVLKELNEEEKRFVKEVKNFLLKNGAISDIIKLDIRIYLPNSLELIDQFGSANTIGYGKDLFIVLRDDFFEEKDIKKVDQLNLRKFYHEYCHGYLGTLYEEEIKNDLKADEDFAWYMENMIADYWQYSNNAKLYPENIEKYRNIYHYKLKKHEENYPLAKKFWKKDWKIPDF